MERRDLSDSRTAGECRAVPSVEDGWRAQQQRLVSRLLAVYLICTAVPFVLVYLFADVIISFYGADFIDMKRVLHISILATIPTCCSDVFKAELIAVGRPWILFSLRMAKDLILVSLACYFLLAHGGASGAYYYTVSNLLRRYAVLHRNGGCLPFRRKTI